MVYFSCLHPKTYGSLIASRPKPIRSPFRILDDVKLFDGGCLTFFQNELRDSITLLHLKVLISMIEEHDFDLPRIVRVDDPSPDVDTVFDGES